MQIEKIHQLYKDLEAEAMDTNGSGRPGKVGVVNLRVTRAIAFVIISVAVIACAVVCVMAVWERIPADYAWRAMASLGIIACATAIFVSLNEGFGPAVRG